MGNVHSSSLCIGLALLVAGAVQAEDWQLAKDEEGIQVYLAPVEGSKYKAYRGVVTIKAEMAEVKALQDDVAGSCSWIRECKKQELIKQEGGKSWTHSYFNTPWPVTPRDSIIEVSTETTPDGGLVRHLLGVPSYLPEEKGYVRVAKVDGLWKLEPKGDDAVQVTYQLHTEPGGSVPSWLANSFVVDAPFNTLKGLRDLAEKP
ncbi:START domain-containing protein [Pseudomonas sp. B392_1p]|uniref:START domain-containing protein n=1 Tax=Pseudomonas sp. B392_1p TaxID=3457507 RepID=UPI003FD169A4